MNAVKVALALAAQGFHVFPLVPNGKVPQKSVHFKDLASNDEERVREMFTDEDSGHRIAANVGVYCGRFGDEVGESLCVIDVDMKPGQRGAEFWRRLNLLIDIPDTRTQTTPSGGKHYVFRTKRPVGNSVSKLGAPDKATKTNIDVRGVGGFFVAAGSTTEKGEYTTDDTPIAELPDELYALCGATRDRDRPDGEPAPAIIELDTDDAMRRAEHYLRNSAPESIKGQGGDATALKVANRVLDFGISVDLAVELMMNHWYDGSGWSEDRLRVKVENAARYRTSPIGVANPTADMTAVSIPKEKRSGLHAVHVRDFGESKPAEPLIKRVLDRGAFSVLFGPSNVGKSFVALDLAFAVARNTAWRRYKVFGGPVVYAALEGGGAMRKRIAAYAKHHGIDPSAVPLYVITQGLNLADPKCTDTMAIIDALHEVEREERAPVRLLVVDTLARAMAGADENAVEQMGALVRNVDSIREQTGCHVVAVHHSGKDASKGARGHSSLRAAVDAEFEVADGLIVTRKQRDHEIPPPWPFRLKEIELGFDPDGERVTSCLAIDASGRVDPSDEFGPITRTDRQDDASRVVAAILAHVSTPGTEPVTRSSLMKRPSAVAGLEGTATTRRIGEIIGAAIEAGSLREVATKRGKTSALVLALPNPAASNIVH